MTKDDLKEYTSSFNPCFNGYYTFTEEPAEVGEEDNEVSILVLMDITLLLSFLYASVCFPPRFQSLF